MKLSLSKVIFLYLVVAAWFSPMSKAFAYDLGPMDVLRIRVAEWQAAEATFREWGPMTGEYKVGPEGRISVPLIGQIEASGKTTEEIASEISDGLLQKYGLIERPEAAVEIVTFRPFYVSGDIDTPGAYPFEPGLTVFKAMTLAGGIGGSSNDYDRVERDVMRTRGEILVLENQLRNLLVRRARVDAELAEKEDFDRPKNLDDSSEVEAILQREKALFSTRQSDLKNRLASFESLKTLYSNELVSLEGKREALLEQAGIIAIDLESVGSLADRGLVNTSRVSELRRAAAEIEGRILDVETAALRANQDIVRADEQAESLRTRYRFELEELDNQVANEIEETRIRMNMQEDLFQEAARLAPNASSLIDTDEISFVITRMIDGESTVFSADRSTEIRPGDVLSIELPSETEGL